jgi:hypothetical protein
MYPVSASILKLSKFNVTGSENSISISRNEDETDSVVLMGFFLKCLNGDEYPYIDDPVVVLILMTSPNSKFIFGSNEKKAFPLNKSDVLKYLEFLN